MTDDSDERTGDDRGASTDGGVDPDGDEGADGQAGSDGDGTPGFDPDEMELEALREEIEAIDRELVESIARRTYVADTIADVKADRGMATTDESQEERVMERAAENAERFDVDGNLVKAIFRLLIELNKIEQRERR